MAPHSPIRFGSVAYRSPSCSGNVAEPMRKKRSFSHPFRASSSRSGAAAPAMSSGYASIPAAFSRAAISGGVRAVVGQKEKRRPVPAQERDELRGAGKRFIAEQQRPVEVEQHRVEPGRVPAEKVEKSHDNKIPTEFGMFIRVK